MAFERLISNTLEAQGTALIQNDPNRLPEIYDPGYLFMLMPT